MSLFQNMTSEIAGQKNFVNEFGKIAYFKHFIIAYQPQNTNHRRF